MLPTPIHVLAVRHITGPGRFGTRARAVLAHRTTTTSGPVAIGSWIRGTAA